MALSVLVSAWLVGTLGGVHCIAMCGGFVTAIAARDAATQPLVSARTLLVRTLAYQTGRIATYGALGGAFGAAGAFALDAIDIVPLQRALLVAANLFLLALAASVALRTPGVAWLQRLGASAFAAGLPAISPLLARPGTAGRVTLGLVWGLMPCALVYSVLPLALFAGGAWQGAAVMLAFGIGTLPNLVASNFLLGRIAGHGNGAALRVAAASLMFAFAVAGIWRALHDPDALASGAFCLAP